MVNILSIFNFLSPVGFSTANIEPLSIICFIIIWELFIFAIIGVKKNANTHNKEKNWYDNDDNILLPPKEAECDE